MSDVGHPARTKARDLIDASMDAYQEARLAAAFCANEGGELAEPHRLQALHDAADLALALANLLTRASHLHRRLARLTAEACHTAADALDEHDDEDALREAREAFWRCADACAALPEPE